MTLFLSSDAFKGVKKVQQKRSFIAKSVMLPKPKTFFDPEKKHHHQFLYFPEEVDVFTFVKIWILGGLFQFLQNKKGLNIDIDNNNNVGLL